MCNGQHRQEEERKAAQEEARLARQVGYTEGLTQATKINKLTGRIQLVQQLLKQPEILSSEPGRLPEANLQELEGTLKQQLSGPKETNGSGSTHQN